MYKLPEIRGSPTETLAHSLSGAGAGVNTKRACGVMRRTHRHCALCMARAHGWRKTGRNKGNTMDTRWLQDFVTLSEVRNFTRAAELRNLSQAAFSRRIQSLEQWLGARLIDRNAYPTQLTDAGERFRAIAIELINQLAEARADIGGARGAIRSGWPRRMRWPPRGCRAGGGNGTPNRLAATLLTGNVHDTVSAFTAGAIDLLVCYHQAAQPPLDLARFDCLTLGGDIIRPYASQSRVASRDWDLPGTPQAPVPLLMYSSSVYFARLIQAAIDERGAAAAWNAGVRVGDVGRAARSGGAGPGRGVAGGKLGGPGIRPCAAGQPRLDVEVAMLAYKQKAARGRP